MNVPTFFYRNQNKTKEFSSIEKFSHLNALLFLFPYEMKSAGAFNRLLKYIRQQTIYIFGFSINGEK